jgi:hypothetical protein
MQCSAYQIAIRNAHSIFYENLPFITNWASTIWKIISIFIHHNTLPTTNIQKKINKIIVLLTENKHLLIVYTPATIQKIIIEGTY